MCMFIPHQAMVKTFYNIDLHSGDVSDNSSPEAEAYVHDTTGDA